MGKYNSRYKTGTTMFVIIEFIGWAIVVTGIIIAIYGFWSGLEEAEKDSAAYYKALQDQVNAALGEFKTYTGIQVRLPGNSSALLRLFDILPGLVISFSGLLSVAVTQVWRSQLHSAEYAREILQILREGAPSPTQTRSPKTISETLGQPVSRPAQTISASPSQPVLDTLQPFPDGEVQSYFDPEVASRTAHYKDVDIYILQDQTAVIDDGGIWRKFNNESDANIYINRLHWRAVAVAGLKTS